MKIKPAKLALNYWEQFARAQDLEIVMNSARRVEWQKIRDVFNIRANNYPDIIELGCGTGHFVINFLKEGFRVTGVDVSKESLKVCQKRAEYYDLEHNLRLVLSDFTKEEFKDKFDAGYLISTFHCLSQDPKEQEVIFRNFIKSIKKGGAIFIMEPNPLNILYYFAYPFVYKKNWREGYNIIHSFPARIKKLLKQEEVSEIKQDYYGFLPTTFINKLSWVKHLNEFFCRIYLLKKFCLFNFFICRKK